MQKNMKCSKRKAINSMMFCDDVLNYIMQVDFLTAKFFVFYENGKIKPDLGFGFVDVGISINIVAILEYLRGDN